MGILLTNIRTKNFRSLESIDVSLGMTNILIGQNNTGKSNFLRAIDIAFGSYRDISENDIHIAEDERLDKIKTAIIDVLIRPIDNNNNPTNDFSDFWTSIFTTTWITTDETAGNFVGIRTKIQYDAARDDYVITRYPISEWNSSIDDARINQKAQFTSDMTTSLTSFYMDAQRDIVEDIKNRKSYFSKVTTSSDMSEEKVVELEGKLNDINKDIIKSIPSLRQTSEKIKAVGNTIGASESHIEIEPLSRKLSDLRRGMDILFQDNKAAKFSISQHGMGTRSWISFLTLAAYVEWHTETVKKDDEEAEYFVILTMEEPEAHLHPQAQRHLYSQIREFKGQKIISTHSPSVLAQADFSDVIHFVKLDGKTVVSRFNTGTYNKEELNKIRREVINTRGELLFSNAIILCEGITEEQALPVYFTEYFDVNPIFYGVNIIGIGGQNYKTFLNLIKDFGIKWFIFSDGEEKTIKTIKSAIKVITTDDIASLDNVVILNNGENYERHLVVSGYSDSMIDAINEHENNPDFFNDYILQHDRTIVKRQKTNKPRCETCGQEIYEDVLREYSGSDGRINALLDCINGYGAKAKYSTSIAEKIISLDDHSKRIPPKVKSLLSEVAKVLHLSTREEYRDD